MDLMESRKQIDEIDEQITELFQKRMLVSEEVAKYKMKTGKKVFDKEREKQKLDTLEQYADNEFNKQGIRELFSQIMSISRKRQYGMITQEKEEVFTVKEKIDGAGKRVVFYGERGSYTEQAMQEFFGEEIEGFNAMTFREVMEAVKNGDADFGVLPIENSSTGGIDDNLDLLIEYNHYIVGEQVIKINQCIMGLPGARLDSIKKVYSHAQGLLQSKRFLDTYPNMKRIQHMSTATSAKKVKEDGDPTQAAIAGKQAAECYGLSILKENINYEATNSTRFIVISKERFYVKGADKICISFLLPHECGSLYNILSHFIFNNLNMTKIESRPIEGRKWEYRFFVEFEGNLSQPGVTNALNGIREETSECRLLGNFMTK